MSPIFTTLAPGLFEAGAKLIDRLIPDPAQREQAKLALFQAEGQQALQEMQVSLSAILAEGQLSRPVDQSGTPNLPVRDLRRDPAVGDRQHHRHLVARRSVPGC